jgi:hypothetical protein
MAFDALRMHSDDDYFEFIERLVDDAAQRLAASSDAAGRQAAIIAYIQQAYDAHLSPGEITDFFCVSSDAVISRLAASEEEIDALVNVFDHLHEAHCGRMLRQP